MLFRKKMPRSCAYCAHGAKIEDEMIVCAKKGIVPITGSCRKFQYDPCKRIPMKQKTMDFSKYDDHDFSL